MSAESSAPKKRIIKPIVISNNQKMVIKSPTLLSNFKFPAKSIQQYKDEIIYSSPDCDFLKGESQEVLIVNRLNLLSRSYCTIARCISRGIIVETTSDAVTTVIGQKNYETVLSALSSVFNEETKVRGILALLTTQKTLSAIATQTEKEIPVAKNLIESSCQTVDTRLNMLVKEKQKKRMRRQPLAPYVVTENKKLKKLVINVDNMANKNLCTVKKEHDTSSLPDLKLAINEDSNISNGSCGNLSLSSLPSVSESIVGNLDGFFQTEIEKVTDKTLNSTVIPLKNGSQIMVPRKPEDIFHIATPDILKNVTHDERRMLIWQQAFIDFKMCLEQDEDGYYPLHIAVLNNDVDLVRRQCLSLRARHETVDIPAGGLTALHMAVRQNVSVECTKLLLTNGADPLLCDQDRHCSLHLAAEVDTPQLRALLTFCDTKARSVLQNNKNFWRPECESQTDEQLTKYLYERISQMFDDEGYTPLMIAAEAAIPSHVALLAARTGRRVDVAAPNCGATALYRATAKACLHAKETGNRITAPNNILKTIEILVEHGADPSIENHSGSSVNTLLTEFNISALSMTIANKMTSIKHGRSSSDGLNMMMFKNDDGKIHWLGKDNQTKEKNKMTEVRYIPPNLLASITVDIPKTKTGLSKKSDNAKAGNNKNICKDKTSIKSDRIDGNSSEEAGCSKIINSNEIINIAPKVVSSSSSINGKDLKVDNIVIKNGGTDQNIKSKDSTVNELSGVIKSAEPANISLNTNTAVKDRGADTNLKFKPVSNVILKHAKSNLNLNIKEANADKTNSNKNIILNPTKVSLNVKDARFGKPVTLTRVTSEKFTEIKQTHLKASPNIVSSDKFINQKDTSLDVAVSKQIQVGNVVKSADETEKKLSIFPPVRHQQFKLLVKDAANKTNLDVAVDQTSNLQDIKRLRNKRQFRTDSEEKPARSVKERKTEKVVIVENVAIKRGFSMPNILKGGTCKTANARDIVISPISSDHINSSPKFVIGKNDIKK